MTPLQTIIFPDPGFCTEESLYIRLSGAVTCTPAQGLCFQPGGVARFDTWFNALGIGRWHRECRLDGLFLSLTGAGEFRLKIIHQAAAEPEKALFHQDITLAGEGLINLSHYLEGASSGLIWFELRALGNACLAGGRFLTRARPSSLSLAICITTFRREKQVEETARRLQIFLQTFPYAARIAVFIIDNGQSANIPPSARITCLPNRNLGGAGGFARAMIAARQAGHSHCLFMDDDAGFQMENIARSFIFLALARAPNAAVAGAMISTAADWRLWENGAVFDRRCRPVSIGADLRNFQDILALESRALAPQAAGFYGGWWFFVFPLAHAHRFPFPFFVRGDDINFSLANDFRINTLLGVASFQDDFSQKESAQTLYLDLRNHLVQHLTIKQLEIGRFSCAGIALWFIFRNAARFQYETCDVLLLAWADVMAGPDFFTENADMRQRRQQIAAMSRQETWQPRARVAPRPRHWFSSCRRRYLPLRPLWRYSLNGHLLPFYRLWANRVVVPADLRSCPDYIRGACRITFLDATGARAYTVALSNRRFARLMWRCLRASLRFVIGYGRLRESYRARHREMTSLPYWRRLLQLTTGEE